MLLQVYSGEEKEKLQNHHLPFRQLQVSLFFKGHLNNTQRLNISIADYSTEYQALPQKYVDVVTSQEEDTVE